MALVQRLFDAIVDGKAQLAKSVVEEEVNAGAEPMALPSDWRDLQVRLEPEYGCLYDKASYGLARKDSQAGKREWGAPLALP
jgi:hypothetical protein